MELPTRHNPKGCIAAERAVGRVHAHGKQHTNTIGCGVYSCVNTCQVITIACGAAIALASRVIADEVRVESHPSNHLLGADVLLRIPEKKPTGLLVLLPAGNIHSYDGDRGYTPSALPRMLATNGVVTLIPAAQPGLGAAVGLYAGDEILEELHRLRADVIHKCRIPEGKLAIGGFSAGGIGAVRYAEFCKRDERRAKTIVAVFAVDAPLDYERWFLASELELKRLALAGRDDAEDRSATNDLAKAFGGSPREEGAAYRRQSAVSTLVADGGNARLLKDTPIHLYVEPDIEWRLQNWNQNLDNSNLPDAVALINVVRLLGNKDARLIATSGKGWRPDGTRNPHSWSIVDEPALATWLISLFAPLESEK